MSDWHHLVETELREYARRGARRWPGASYFVVAALDGQGQTTGSGADLCRDCVQSVARALTDGRTCRAIETVGSAAAYDIRGESDLDALRWCAECGLQIEG